MRVALAVNMVTRAQTANLAVIEELIGEAATGGAELVLFGETALTGALNNDRPDHDLPLGVAIPGPETQRLATLARRHGLFIAIGLLERAGECLYDSAVLLDDDGRLVLHYRRISGGWRGQLADRGVYREGESIPLCTTRLGSVAFLICGDLFDDALVERVRLLRPSLLLLPFTRSNDAGATDQTRWERDDEPEYAARAQRTGATLLMANYFAGPGLTQDDGSFGGAAAFDTDGCLIARLPQGQTGLLLVDLPDPLSQT